MSGATDLATLLASMEPTVRPGEFVYCLLPTGTGMPEAQATVVEDEGVTVVLRREHADSRGLGYDFVAGWITLTVHSSLEAVGLTAAFAAALGDEGISCNVLAGLHHDHLLVPVAEVDRAMAALRALSATA